MREFDLPSPKIGGKGHQLRRMAANAISQMEVSAMSYAGGKHPEAVSFASFFRRCIDGIKTIMPAADNIVAEVSSGQPFTVPVTGTYSGAGVGTASFTVVNGTITGIVLS